MAEQTHDRINLASEQLDLSLEIFLSGRSAVAALTLAGAAEEIFGKALASQDKKTTLQYEYKVIAPLEEFLRREPLTWKVFVEEKNRIRNAAKHMNDQSQRMIVADIEDEALRILLRACDNYKRLGLSLTDRITEFDKWFLTNVVGVHTDDT